MIPYLFHYNNSFALIDYSQRNGVFCQFYNRSSGPRALAIQNGSIADYSACLDHDNVLHVIAMADAFHMNYYRLEGHRFTKDVLVSNITENYHLSSPILYDLNHQLCMIYLSHQDNSSLYSFVHQALDSPDLTTLLNLNIHPEHMKHFTHDGSLYIFYTTTTPHHHQLKSLRITGTQAQEVIWLDISLPIVDYAICFHHEVMHIALVTECHGKYELSYFNTASRIMHSLCTTSTPPTPTIFYYYNGIWLNIMMQNKLHMMLSMDDGETFSIPVPCTKQAYMRPVHFHTTQSTSLSGQLLYASTNHQIILSTLYYIDFEHLHPDVHIASEIELLLDGLNQLPQREPLPQPPAPMPEKKSEPVQTANPIKSATDAFMGELSGWDLPPRL